jgi:murein DD-endopeptidase MepM/ murein hydrolase activator NlpD
VSNIVKKGLFFARASLPFGLVFSLVVLPTTKSAGEELLKQVRSGENSQTIKVLKPEVNPVLGGGTGGGDILVEENALVASGISEGNGEKSKVIRSGADAISVYIVRQGDTLSQIAEMFGVKVSTIRGFNNIRKDTDLRAGQELLILPIDGLAYKVEKGDTLASIAKKFKSDEMDIALFNDLPEDDKLNVGAEIIIPNAEPLPAPEEPKKPATNSSSSSSKPASQPSSPSSGYASYPAGFYAHPIPRGAVKSQGFHGPYQAQDLAAREGTDIVASSGGRVIAVRYGWSGGYGNMLIIDDGRANVLYAHMSRIDVTEGQVVTQGQKIGEVGNTGRSTGPHLHVEYRGKNGPIKTPVW